MCNQSVAGPPFPRAFRHRPKVHSFGSTTSRLPQLKIRTGARGRVDSTSVGLGQILRYMQAIALACAVLFGTSSGALAQTTLNLSQDLVRLGIAATNMTPNQSALDAGPLLLAGVNYAKANGLNRVIADQGAYYFLGAGITGLNQVNNTTIDFSKTTGSAATKQCPPCPCIVVSGASRVSQAA